MGIHWSKEPETAKRHVTNGITNFFCFSKSSENCCRCHVAFQGWTLGTLGSPIDRPTYSGYFRKTDHSLGANMINMIQWYLIHALRCHGKLGFENPQTVAFPIISWSGDGGDVSRGLERRGERFAWRRCGSMGGFLKWGMNMEYYGLIWINQYGLILMD